MKKTWEVEIEIQFKMQGLEFVAAAAALFLQCISLASCSKSATASVQQQQQVDFEDPTGYFTPDSLHGLYDQRATFDQYLTYSLRSLALVAGYDNDLHRYDSRHDLLDSYERLNWNHTSYSSPTSSSSSASAHSASFLSFEDWASAGGQTVRLRRQQARGRVDSSELSLFSDQGELAAIENELQQEECARQLDQLIEMALNLFRNFESFSSSRQLGLIELLDSFGSAPREQLLMGNNMWLGSYAQCSNSRVLQANAPPLLGRYCVAKLRSPNWSAGQLGPQEAQTSDQALKMGVCLPRSCNSISILRHSSKLETLIKMARLQQVPFSSYKLHQLHCLPDEASPLRQLSGSARAFVACLLAWLVFVLYFSVKFELQLARARSLSLPEPSNQQAGGWLEVFALRRAWRSLFGSPEGRASSATKLGQPNGRDESSARRNGGRVSLAPVDGIKVLSMVWLISAHTMLFFVRLIANGRDFWIIMSDARFMTILAGIFPVDTFFTVTGVLTAYLRFSKHSGGPMLRPGYWLEAFVRRYLRFMPLYLVVFWYSRDVSQYIGQGPMWDYATANTSLRAMCKLESFAVPLTFQANFKPIDQHCIKPAWYLANDFQFMLVTPIFVALLMCSKWFGYFALLGSIVASLVAQFYTVYYDPQFGDFSTLNNFKPMFATYLLTNLWKLYTLPYNRIAPYLVGLLTGHLMYSEENRSTSLGKLQRQAVKTTLQQAQACNQCQQLAKANVHQSNTVQAVRLQQAPGLLPPPPPVPNSLLFLESVAHQMDLACGKEKNEPIATICHPSQLASSASEESLVRDTSAGSSPSVSERHLCRRDIGKSAARERVVKLPTTPGAGGERQQAIGSNNLSALIDHFVCIRVWSPLMLLISIIYLPLITKLTSPQEGEQAHIGASLIIALTRFVWSIAIARLIYVCCCWRAKSLQADCLGGESTTNGPKTNDSFIIGLLEWPA